MSRYLILVPLLILSAAGAAYAQNVVMPTDNATIVTDGPHFFVALVAGLILALAFQLMLTTLSLATGLQAIHPGEDDDGEDAYPYGAERHAHMGMHERTARVGEKARTVSSAVGVWAVITASVALFFASWLAVELSLTADVTSGAVIGLVIWGLFYIAMMMFEVRSIRSVVGSLTRTASRGLRTARHATAGVVHGGQHLAESPTASNIVTRVREELFGDMETQQLTERLRNYMRDFQMPPQLSKEAIRSDLRLMFHDPHAGADALISRLRSIDRDTLRQSIASRPDISQEDAEQILMEMEAARDEAIERATRMKEEVARRVEAAKEEAVHVADEVRRTAATASWWAFIAALVSGIASALGGMVAVWTGPYA